MLKPPCDADEAFGRLAPDLEEIKDFVGYCPLTVTERKRLAVLLGDYFHRLANSCEPVGRASVRDAEGQPQTV
jgi:hypothetical protein